MLKMTGWKVNRKPRSECKGADPANLSKRYAFILQSTDGYIYCWNGSKWSKDDEQMFTFSSEFAAGTDGFKLDEDEAIDRADIQGKEAPPCRAGFLAVEVQPGREFPRETGAYARDDRMLYEMRDRRVS